MTDLELKQLQMLLAKLSSEKPELTVLVTDATYDTVHSLCHENEEFFCPLDIQVDICLDDETNTVLR